MKKFYIIMVTLSIVNGVTGLLQAQTGINADDMNSIASHERDANAWKFLSAPAETGENYDVKWYRCWWNIDPAIRAISGNVTTLFAPVGQGLNSLSFDLKQVLTVDSVLYHNNPVVWEHNSNLVNINFSSILPPQVVDSVTVYYHGVPSFDGSGSFVQETHQGVPIIWTLSVPYAASNWWPSKIGLTDKADSIDIYIKTPSVYSTATIGVLVSESQVGSNTVYHWKHRYPIANYVINIAVTNYMRNTQQVSFGGNTLNILNCAYPEDTATIFSEAEILGPAIQLFDSLFGIYPFQNEKYGQAEYGTVGMENQTMSFISTFSFNVMTHELAHQWFGNKITCGSWSDIWLNEGFAVYLTGLCYEHFNPSDWKGRRQGHINLIISQPGGSLYCQDTLNLARLFDHRLSYEKGAMVLHQLRWIMGDSAFFSALKNYISDASLTYGFVRTSDLKSHLESSYGQDLTWYFDDWYTGQGYPSYHVDWEQSGDNVTFTLTQHQSHPSVSFFEMPVPVQFKNGSRDTIIRVSNTFSGQTFTVNLPFTVDTVIIDPDCQLITGPFIVGDVADHSWQRGLQVYPNPAHNYLTIDPEKSFGKISYKIYSSDGKFVTSGIIGDRPQQVNLTMLADGFYSIVFQYRDLSTSRTFIKTR